jgi:hypothetical protein
LYKLNVAVPVPAHRPHAGSPDSARVAEARDDDKGDEEHEKEEIGAGHAYAASSSSSTANKSRNDNVYNVVE